MLHYSSVFALAAVTFLLGFSNVPSGPLASKEYAPCVLGTRLVYECTVVEDKKKRVVYEFTRVVMACKRDKDATIVSIGEPDGEKVNLYCKIVVSENGLSLYEFNGEKPRDQLMLLKLPYKAGQKWQTSFPWEDGHSLEIDCVSSNSEIVQVPAGKYTAIRVDSECVQERLKMNATTWYAIGIGPIKSRQTLGPCKTEIVLKSRVDMK